MKRLAALSLLLISAADPVLSPAVRIGGCGGTIVHQADGRLWGISAGHCSTAGEAVVVRFADGSTATGKWLHIDREIDLAAFVVAFSTHKVVQVAQIAADGVTGDYRADGSRGIIKLARDGHKAMKSTAGGTYQRTLYTVKSGKFRNGDSGAGVWAGRYLVGVASHGDDDEELYACRLGQLREFAAKLSAVAELPDWGDKDRTREILELKKLVAALEKRLDSVKDGIPGPPGPAGAPGTASDLTGIEARLMSLEDFRSNFRATIRVRLQPVAPKEKNNDGN